MLRCSLSAMTAAAVLLVAGSAMAGEAPAGITAQDFFKAQGALLGVGAVNDKIALGGAHLLCREAAAAAESPVTPGSASRTTARIAFKNVTPALDATKAQADALLIQGLKEAGIADASAETVALLATQARVRLASERLQVNPATAKDLAVTCRALAAGEFSDLSTAVASR